MLYQLKKYFKITAVFFVLIVLMSFGALKISAIFPSFEIYDIGGTPYPTVTNFSVLDLTDDAITISADIFDVSGVASAIAIIVDSLGNEVGGSRTILQNTIGNSFGGTLDVSGLDIQNYKVGFYVIDIFLNSSEECVEGCTDCYCDFNIDSQPNNNEAFITSFGFGISGETSVAGEYAFTITVPFGTDVTNLIATFTASEGAVVKIGSTVQESGTTANDFSSPKTYTIVSEDGLTINNYTMTVVVLEGGLTTSELWDGVNEIGWAAAGSYWDIWNDPYQPSIPASRAQFIVFASELGGSQGIGMIGGDRITSIHLKNSILPHFDLENFKIRIKAVGGLTLSTSWESNGWTNFFGSQDIIKTDLEVNQWKEYVGHTDFTWDGVSNIMIDISRDAYYDESSWPWGEWDGEMKIKQISSENRMFAGNCADWDNINNGICGDFLWGNQSYSSESSYDYVPSIKITYER